MHRRTFIKKAGLGSLAGLSLTACNQNSTKAQAQTKQVESQPKQTVQWRMVTTWPKNYPIFGEAMERLSQLVSKMSSGRFKIKVYGGGELLPAFEALDAVSKGAVEMAHSASLYWSGKDPALQFFSAIPFGMNALQMDAWLYNGGGLELWQEVYKPFNVTPIPAGDTGMQMGGWFNREINSINDFKGLKMRLPGLGGQVINRVGGLSVSLPGAELLTAMQTKVVDATEWINPYLDLAFGLDKVAKYYYYPGWHSPGAALECIVNQDAMNALPEDLKAMLHSAIRSVSGDIMNGYVSKNGAALAKIKQSDSIILKRLPDSVIEELRRASILTVEELSKTSDLTRRIHKSYTGFMRETRDWLNISEKIYYDMTI
ncbi:MAG: TRAP transporter substrate-binding protein [Candidatus Oxydemutatoraceae bacterium WSBS_2016_MAG_OTU14]